MLPAALGSTTIASKILLRLTAQEKPRYRHPATIIAQVMFATFEMPNSLDKLPNSPA